MKIFPSKLLCRLLEAKEFQEEAKCKIKRVKRNHKPKNNRFIKIKDQIVEKINHKEEMLRSNKPLKIKDEQSMNHINIGKGGIC